MTSSKSLLSLTNRLRDAGIPLPELEARWLLKYSFSSELESNVARRVRHEPLAKILGSKGFYKYEFKTTADTLDPRDDSEALLSLAFQRFPDKAASLKVADICSGTGCLGLSFAAEYPAVVLTMVDVSAKAMAVARDNAAAMGLTVRTSFFTGDMDVFQENGFHLLFFNPPYLRTSELLALDADTAYDPVIALDGGEDGLTFYRRFNAAWLAADGCLIAEIGAEQRDAVVAIMRDKGLFLASEKKDLGGVVRALLFTANRLSGG